MALQRSHLSKAIIRTVSGAPSGGSCLVVLNGSNSAPVTAPLYSDATTTLTLSNPFTFTQGAFDLYTAMPMRVNLVITPTGGTPQTFYAVDFWPAPDDITVSGEGLLANRPAPSRPNFRYFATDNGVEYLDDGTNWRPVGDNSGYSASFLLMGA